MLLSLKEGACVICLVGGIDADLDIDDHGPAATIGGLAGTRTKGWKTMETAAMVHLQSWVRALKGDIDI